MIKFSHGKIELDAVDKAILKHMQQEGRLSVTDLAQRISLSVPATHTRLRQLESANYIERYVALVNKEKIGYDLMCYIHISFSLHQPEQFANFIAAIRDFPEVLECHKVTGEYDYMMKVIVRNHRALERFLSDKLTRLPGIARTHTYVVVDELKSVTAVPVE